MPGVSGTSSPDLVKNFSGTGPTTTAAFQVSNKWMLRWHSQVPFGITVYSADGTVVASAEGVQLGSMHLPTGGAYYLEINAMSPPPTTTNNQNQSPPQNPLGSIDDPIGGRSNNENNQAVNQQQGIPVNYYNWNVDVVALGAPGAGGLSTATSTPALLPAAPATPAPVVKLTEAQSRAVVLIKGDTGEGTGFLVQTPDGPEVVTNLHVIGNNPNIKITTNTGAEITMISAKGASDRDLALLAIKDAGYSYLDLATDLSNTVQTGDDLVTPGNSQGGEVMLNTGGKLLGIGPQRIEFDNPIYHGNSGGPVFHTKSNKVLGVVTEAMKVDTSNDLDKASFASRNSAISGAMRYFGLRLDTVPSWVPLDWRRFQNETTFLDQFNFQSRSLDSYLNPPSASDASSNSDDAKLYLRDKKIMAANDDFVQQAKGNDTPQRVEAFKELLFDLDSIADKDMDQIQNMDNFYSFDQERAKEEIAYRKALRSELDSISTNVSRMDSFRRSSDNN